MKRRILLAVVVLLMVAYGLSGVTLIRPGERAVVRRFGRVLEQKPGPGLFVGLPWGMDHINRVPVNLVRRVEVGYQPADEEEQATAPVGQLLTGDHNLVNIRVVIDYTVDPGEEEIVNYVLQADRADEVVARAVEALLAEEVAGRTIDGLLMRGKAELPPLLRERVQDRIADYHLGIRVADASVAYLLPPTEVKPAFDDVTRAQTAIDTQVHNAQQTAARELRRAQERRYSKEQDALTYAYAQQRQAEADAARFEARLAKYRELRRANPDVLASIWWDEMGRLFTAMKQDGRIDMLDHHLGSDGLDITTVLPRKR
jgi:membrane protease subunit HflK